MTKKRAPKETLLHKHLTLTKSQLQVPNNEYDC